MIRKVGRLRLAKLLSEYKKGKHLRSDAFQDILIFMRGKRMEITCEQSVVVNFDGECQPLSQISFRVLPQALNFLVPGRKTGVKQMKFLRVQVKIGFRRGFSAGNCK